MAGARGSALLGSAAAHLTPPRVHHGPVHPRMPCFTACSCSHAPGKNTGMACHAFLQGPSLASDGTCVSCFLHWQVGSLPLVPPGKPYWLAYHISFYWGQVTSPKSSVKFLEWITKTGSLWNFPMPAQGTSPTHGAWWHTQFGLCYIDNSWKLISPPMLIAVIWSWDEGWRFRQGMLKTSLSVSVSWRQGMEPLGKIWGPLKNGPRRGKVGVSSPF